MNKPTYKYSTNPVTEELISKLKGVIEKMQWGSIELHVQDGNVVQITKRVLEKLPLEKIDAPNQDL